jgi:glucose-1-phosphate cytidylyltransferase
MKAVILAGGLGTRLSEETANQPKPMVQVGGQPLLWHIMRTYSAHGINEFVICLGYRGYVIKEYFADYVLHRSSVTVDLRSGSIEMHDGEVEPWKVSLVDTGAETMTGGRIRRVLPYVAGETFCLTYGDGLSDVDITALLKHHDDSGATVTVTSVQPPGRFGGLEFNGDRISRFVEKAPGDGGWVNGGYFVVSPGVTDYLPEGDDLIWEREPLENLAQAGELGAYRHTGFWQPVDTLRDLRHVEALWQSGSPPWTSAW